MSYSLFFIKFFSLKYENRLNILGPLSLNILLQYLISSCSIEKIFSKQSGEQDVGGFLPIEATTPNLLEPN